MAQQGRRSYRSAITQPKAAMPSDPRRLSFLHPIKSRAISVIIRQHSRSMRQHAAHGTGGKQFMRHTTECPFTQSTMTIANSNDQIGFLLLHELE